MTRQALLIAAAIAAVAGAANAQVRPTPLTLPARVDSTTPAAAAAAALGRCPGGNGIHISATTGTGTDSSSGSNRVIGLGQSVDTTLVFDISRKTWTRTNIAAQITVGIADESRGTYAVCAGVSALLPSATLTISGARGTVHFAATLADFTNSLRQPAAR
jgi:hypothetical protein